MISQNDLYKFIGLAVVALFLIHIAVKSFKYQTKIVEGMTSSSNTDRDKIADAIDQKIIEIDDKMRVGTFRHNYEDAIISFEKFCSETILKVSMDKAPDIVKDPLSKENQEVIVALNNLAQFRNTLNDAMVTLDKK